MANISRSIIGACLLNIAVTSSGLAQTVIYNSLNNKTGGTGLSNSRYKAIIFQTGSTPTKLNSLTFGLNPNAGIPPTTAKLTVEIWSVNSSGKPTSRLKTLVNGATVQLNSAQQNYSYSLNASDSLLLNAKTKYALVLSSDAAGIKWSNNLNDAVPSGKNGYSVDPLLVSEDSGGTWIEIAAAQNNTIDAEIFSIPYNALMPQSYAGFLSVGLETLKRQRELLLSEAGSCEENGWVIDRSKSKEAKKSPVNKAKNRFCFNALATTSTSYINGNSELFSYQSGITSGFYLVEYKASPLLKLGLAYGNGNSYLNSMPETNAAITANVNSGSLYGIYTTSDNLTIRGLLGYANFAAQSSRNVQYLDNGTAITSNPNANGYTVALDAKYLLQSRNPKSKYPFYLAPKVGIAWGGYSQNAFTESGVDYLNLSIDSHTANSVIGTVSSEVGTKPIPLNQKASLAFRPKLSVGYQVDMLGNASDQMTLNQSFSSAPAAGSFAVQGQNRGVNNLYVEGGLEFLVGKSTSLYAMTALESFSNGSQFNYSGGIRIAF